MRALVLVALVVATPAWADDARVAARLAAEHLAADADRTHDLATYAACGQAYVDLYNQEPEASDNDEILYNSSVCFEKSGAVGSAIMTRSIIGKYYPSSKLTPKVTLANGLAYARVGYYDRAAEHLETYARKYPAEKDAADALVDAIRYRTALGDFDKQLADTESFLKAYGTRRPKEAAALRYAAVSLYQRSPESEGALLRSYLKTYASVIDDDQAIVARVRLADVLWASSCPVPLVDGLCVKLVIDRPGPDRRCGSSAIVRVAAVPRTSAKQEALDVYREAAQRFERTPASVTAVGRHAAAMARLALADAELEHMIEASTFPKDLDFDPVHQGVRTRSVKRFSAWLATEQHLGTALDQQYSAILAIKDPEASIAAAARIGQTVLVLWRALLIGEIPGSVRTGALANEKLAAYCGEMRGVAEPLGARAAEAFATCAVKAGELGASGAWANLCWREGALLAPDRFPPARELHADPAPGAMPVELAGP